jgi:hypothetical protein
MADGHGTGGRDARPTRRFCSLPPCEEGRGGAAVPYGKLRLLAVRDRIVAPTLTSDERLTATALAGETPAPRDIIEASNE